MKSLTFDKLEILANAHAERVHGEATDYRIRLAFMSMVQEFQSLIAYFEKKEMIDPIAISIINESWQEWLNEPSKLIGNKIADEFADWIGDDFEPPIVAFEDYSYDQAEYE